MLVLLALMAVGCEGFWNQEPEQTPLARVGDHYFYQEDLEGLIGEDLSPQDSAALASSLINTWATRQLLMDKARLNLPESQLEEYEKLVADYRTDLYTRAYKEALVAEAADTLIAEVQLRNFYEAEKDNFRLQEPLVQLRFVELPRQFLNTDEVRERLRRFEQQDLTYLDSVGVQFRKLHFNDSLWIQASRVIDEIPPLTPENAGEHLRKDHFFELEDESGVYLAEVVDVLEINDIAPLSFIEPTLRQVLLNRRKMSYLDALERDLLKEAVQQKAFETYETN
ncbi:peptidyl-prolyl cis-trans isomerase [Robiginitalea sp. M366]|uniref:peptidyl-prolyl cis-trans isomerase n=1 Tax=Robiginitalea aestuariiviva TaxID=3036903 RepID=UPI00240DE5E6|nr:peptidyl-prolyl cis-trans isomerase [Robiginitalea aestuariiviva]MDG1572429.1 peptidyl-prolyl cis-trans isomerase [Robiginitalea aestuariiviva]